MIHGEISDPTHNGLQVNGGGGFSAARTLKV